MANTIPANLTLTEIAARINAHVRRLEAGPRKSTGEAASGFFWAGAFVSGNRVGVRYVSYQGVTNLTRREALHYLAALDDGWEESHHVLFQRNPPPKDDAPDVRFHALIRERYGFVLYAVTKRTESRLYGSPVAGYAGQFVPRSSVVKMNATMADYKAAMAAREQYDAACTSARRTFNAALDAIARGEQPEPKD